MEASRRANAPPSRVAADDYVRRLRNIYIGQYLRSDSRPAKICEGLFLGSVGAAYTRNSLKTRRITHVLTVCDCLPPKFPGEFVYKVVEVMDDPSVKLSSHFQETNTFIHNAIGEGGSVLVHCFAGVSRSASVVIAYLMKHQHMTYQSAFTHVQTRRPWINPNPGFIMQLKRYEAWLKEQR